MRGRTKLIKGRRTALLEIAAQEGEEDGSSAAGVEDSMDIDKVSSHTSFEVAIDAEKPVAPGSESDFEPDGEPEDSQPTGASDGGLAEGGEDDEP